MHISEKNRYPVRDYSNMGNSIVRGRCRRIPSHVKFERVLLDNRPDLLLPLLQNRVEVLQPQQEAQPAIAQQLEIEQPQQEAQPAVAQQPEAEQPPVVNQQPEAEQPEQEAQPAAEPQIAQQVPNLEQNIIARQINLNAQIADFRIHFQVAAIQILNRAAGVNINENALLGHLQFLREHGIDDLLNNAREIMALFNNDPEMVAQFEQRIIRPLEEYRPRINLFLVQHPLPNQNNNQQN